MKQITYLLSLTVLISAVALSGLSAHTGTPSPDVPIGAIIAWHKSLGGVPQSLPSGWVELTGGGSFSDPHSPLNGQVIPNLNQAGLFLRGATTSGGGDSSPTHVHLYANTTDIEDGDTDVSANAGGDTVTVSALGHAHTSSGTTLANATPAVPPYFTIVWIMRIK